MQGTVPAIRPGWRVASAHDTAARATIRQARRVGARAWRKGACVTCYDTALGRLRHSGFGLRYGRGPRPRYGQACPRYGQACAHLGAPVRTYACQLGQLGARVSGLVFRSGFRLGDIFESPFGPGS